MDITIATQALDKLIAESCTEKGINFSALNLTSEFNLLDHGIFDSLGFLQLIASLEENLGVEIDLSDSDPDEFTVYGKLIGIICKSRI